MFYPFQKNNLPVTWFLKFRDISGVNISIGNAANLFVSAKVYSKHSCDRIPANLGYCFSCRNVSVSLPSKSGKETQ